MSGKDALGPHLVPGSLMVSLFLPLPHLPSLFLLFILSIHWYDDFILRFFDVEIFEVFIEFVTILRFCYIYIIYIYCFCYIYTYI